MQEMQPYLLAKLVWAKLVRFGQFWANLSNLGKIWVNVTKLRQNQNLASSKTFDRLIR